MAKLIPNEPGAGKSAVIQRCSIRCRSDARPPAAFRELIVAEPSACASDQAAGITPKLRQKSRDHLRARLKAADSSGCVADAGRIGTSTSLVGLAARENVVFLGTLNSRQFAASNRVRIAGRPLQHLSHRADHAFCLRHESLLECGARWRRRIRRRDPQDRRLQGSERFGSSDRRDFGSHTAESARLVHHEQSPGFAQMRGRRFVRGLSVRRSITRLNIMLSSFSAA